MSGSAALLTNDRPSCKHSTAIGRKCSPSVRASTPNVSTQSADSQVTLITQGRAQDPRICHCRPRPRGRKSKTKTESALVVQLAETQCAPTGTVCRRSWGSIPGSTGRFCVRILGAHALRLISRAGKEGSTVSSIICDRWLIELSDAQ